ncbi:MAG: hypothetical protein ACOYNS_05540 [Bacteroidota bacterium]
MKRMQILGVIPEYNSSIVPVSRGEIASLLQRISGASALTVTDKSILSDLMIEFSYDLTHSDTLTYAFFEQPGITSIFEESKQKYLYHYIDTSVAIFLDGIASLSQRGYHGDRYNNGILLGRYGGRFRGTLYETVGFYVKLSNGQAFEGNSKDRNIAALFDPILFSSQKFSVEQTKYVDSYEGYIRFQNDMNSLSLILGRERVQYGFGYLDKIFLSGNNVPFDYAKFDLRYKSVQYSFLYGNIVGDSLGRTLTSKLIVSQRLSLNLSSIKFGIFEALIIPERSISFTYLNPVNFLVSSDLSLTSSQTTNSYLGFDFEYTPVRNIALQASLLVDDVNLSTISKKDSTANDNKFAYQLGFEWQNALTIPNLVLIAEYTRVGPFVYSHRSNMATFTHWKISLGHAIPPNSDEAAVRLAYDISSRLNISGTYKTQRSSAGLRFSPAGKLMKNFGGDLLRGDGDFLQFNEFLQGDRTSKTTASFDLRFEPIRQFVIGINYMKIGFTDHVLNKEYHDDLFTINAEIDF